MQRFRRHAALFPVFVLGWFVLGCQAPTIPDPNDPAQKGPNQVQALQGALKAASDAANDRVIKGQITQDQAKSLVDQYAQDLTKDIDIKAIAPADANIYGNIFLTAHQWDKAREVLRVAVKYAKNEDRRVNDSLRLAQACAEMGDVPDAIKVASSTFNTGNTEKAPILPAILYTIVPPAQHKGHDKELAELLKHAIYEHEQTVVNPSTEAGKMFLFARLAHVHKAWDKVLELIHSTGDTALEQKTAAEARKNLQSLAVV